MTTHSDDGARWIRRFHPAPEAAIRMVCLAHAGGSASYFHRWSLALSPRIEVLAVQYPGREDWHREPLIDNIRELATGVASALAPFVDRPFALFGHSMGASVAFELAQTLEQGGAGPEALVVSARRAPPGEPSGRRRLLSDEALLREVEQLGGTMPTLLDDPDLARLVLPVLRNDYRASQLYWSPPGVHATCPIIGMTGSDDPLVSPDEARNWATRTTGRFTLDVLPGGHFYLDEHRSAVLRRVASHLLAADDVACGSADVRLGAARADGTVFERRVRSL